MSLLARTAHAAIVAVGLFLLADGAEAAETTSPLERVVRQHDGQRQTLLGRVVVEAADGGLLFETRDARYWTIQPDELAERERTTESFAYYDKDALALALLKELPDDFQVYHTANYLILYNTSKAYAQWCGGLFERLHRGFFNYWKQRGLELESPESPLVAIIFRDRAGFKQYARPELGESVDSVIGYYSLTTHRMATFDLTGSQAGVNPDVRQSLRTITALLSRPRAAATVATNVHEATHQLVYGSGMVQRFADVPLWLNEGLAMYFETPDLRSQNGWRTIGARNGLRLPDWRAYGRRRPADSLETLLRNSERFRTAESVNAAYAESWALVYYLLKRKPAAMVKYLEQMQTKGPLLEDGPEGRLRDFREAFGEDLDTFDRGFRSAW